MNSCDCGWHWTFSFTIHYTVNCVGNECLGKKWISRGSLNLSVQLLLFPFASNQLTYAECCDILSGLWKVQLHQELSETVVISSHLFISSAPLSHYHIVILTTSVKTTCEQRVIYQRKWHYKRWLTLWKSYFAWYIILEVFESWKLEQRDVWRKQQHQQ